MLSFAPAHFGGRTFLGPTSEMGADEMAYAWAREPFKARLFGVMPQAGLPSLLLSAAVCMRMHMTAWMGRLHFRTLAEQSLRSLATCILASPHAALVLSWSCPGPVLVLSCGPAQHAFRPLSPPSLLYSTFNSGLALASCHAHRYHHHGAAAAAAAAVHAVERDRPDQRQVQRDAS